MPDLFAKVGPLPAWAWGALVVAGYLFWSHTRAAKIVPTGDGTVDTTDTSGTDTTGTPSDFGSIDPSSAGYNYGSVNDGTYTGTTSGTAFTSNQTWGVAAIETLIRAGVSASTATSGITHYLAGQPLTSDEASAVNAAITLQGPPPLPMPIMLVSNTPPTQPVTTTDPGPAPTPDPAPTPVVDTTPSAPTSPFTPPTYATGSGTQNPYIASDNISLTGTAAAQVIAKLAAHGVQASTANHQGVTGWEGWSPNLWIYTHGEQPTDPIANQRGPLSTIVSPYSNAANAQAAMAAL